ATLLRCSSAAPAVARGAFLRCCALPSWKQQASRRTFAGYSPLALTSYKSFATPTAAIAVALPLPYAILDGKIVHLDTTGRIGESPPARLLLPGERYEFVCTSACSPSKLRRISVGLRQR